ncbi:MAG: hypothetical protein QOD38_569, partial [Acidimicrobiaceae bacterium]
LLELEKDPNAYAFGQAVASMLAGGAFDAAAGPVDRVKVAAAYRGYVAVDDRLGELITIVTTAVQAAARDLAARERREYLAWAAGTAALALASIAVARMLARSIARPLQDLARYAHEVNTGVLDAEASPSGHLGPRETRLVYEVVTDLVSNLQLLDAKANALARCDFDDPALREPLPGRLGQSLESSVALLSGSIVERDQLQTHLAHQATHDSLTGIGNRPAAITAIQAAVQRASRTGATTAVLFIDLNEFKAVNDSHGHEVGDEVLREVSRRITSDLRSGDFVARLGGDEFVVVAEELVDATDATELARRLIETISRPVEFRGLHLTIGAAVGIALTLDGPEEPLRLLARADAAMYRAKHHDRSGIEIFDAGLQQQMVEREDIEAALTAALADANGGGLHLEYQPLIDAATGEMVGTEALVRWDRPGHGTLLPDAFVPIAEATALIIDLDVWVLTEATRQLAEWSADRVLAEVPVSVNISGRHLLSRRLPDHIREVLARSGVGPHRLNIEITETVLLTDLVSAASELDAVRCQGVEVAIDDFGTGYTSLAHLQQLPIDAIKIDRSFIRNIGGSRGRALVRMMTDLGHAIDINIVAEGVETNHEMVGLQSIGIDRMQGYLFSPPLAPRSLAAWAHDHVSVRAGGETRTPTSFDTGT